MLATVVDNINRTRAIKAMNIEYIKEGALDDELDDRLEMAESLYVKESTEELLEAKELYDKLSDKDEYTTESEIQRILDADHDLTFDEMVGIEELAEKI